MMFMNTWEIDEAVQRYKNHPILGPASQLLSDVRDLANENSDGWAYWKAPCMACKKLQTLIQQGHKDFGRGEQEVTQAQLKAAIPPIKRFCTKHNLPFPELKTPIGGLR